MAAINVSLTNIKMYNEIVAHTYKRYQELTTTYDELQAQNSATNSDENENFYALENAMDHAAAIILVFSEMTLEAFCNAYLLTKYSKNSFKDMSFIDKVDHTIVTMLKECGITISAADIKNYYGGDVKRIICIRKRFVHRYPVVFDLDTDSDEKFAKTSVAAADNIEGQFLRRVSKADVENAATAYQKFKDTLNSVGFDFSKIGFDC